MTSEISTGLNPLTTLGRATVDAADDAALDDVVRDLVTETFTFRQAGVRTDVEGYLTHLRTLRATYSSARLTVLDELVDRSVRPARAAVRFTMRMHRPDGSVVEGEAHTFAVLDGDRVAALHDLGRFLEPDDDRP